jgi:hypothetical protein
VVSLEGIIIALSEVSAVTVILNGGIFLEKN